MTYTFSQIITDTVSSVPCVEHIYGSANVSMTVILLTY